MLPDYFYLERIFIGLDALVYEELLRLLCDFFNHLNMLYKK